MSSPSAPQLRERWLELGLAGCAVASVVTAILLVVSLVVMSVISGGSLLLVLALMVGSLVVSAVALAVAAPLGLAAGIHLSDYTSATWRGRLEVVLQVFAGVPTIIYAILAVAFVTPLLQTLDPTIEDQSVLCAGLVLGLLLTPTLTIACADALRSVPGHMREAAWALGAGEAATLSAVVLPAATPKIRAAIWLAFARAFGETMIVYFAAGSGALDLSIELVDLFDVRHGTTTPAVFIVPLTQAGPRDGVLVGEVYLAALALTLVSVLANRRARRLQGRAGEASA
jgi:phosphate transport system permease protein